MRYANISIELASKKYNALSPKIANIFDVYSIIGSFDIPKIAGIESIANTKSVSSITAIQASKGVAIVFPLTFVKNLPPSY